jgi:hypothetical protein
MVGGNRGRVRALGDAVELVEVEARAGVGLCALRAEGVSRTQGARIAVLGARYEVGREWMRAAESSEWDVATGPVGPGQLSYWGWVTYLSEYARLGLGGHLGAVEFGLVAGNNAVYRREVMDKELLGSCLTELEFHAELARRGWKAGRLRELEVEYARPPGVWEYITERFCFSAAIARERRQRWRVLVAPLLPGLVLWRTFAGAAGMRWRAAACAPVILVLGLVQAAGEAWGCVRYSDGFGGAA